MVWGHRGQIDSPQRKDCELLSVCEVRDAHSVTCVLLHVLRVIVVALTVACLVKFLLIRRKNTPSRLMTGLQIANKR